MRQRPDSQDGAPPLLMQGTSYKDLRVAQRHRRNVRSTSRLMRDCGVLRCTDRSTANTALPTYEIRAKVHVHRRLPTWAQCPSAHISSIRISRSPAGRMDPAAGTRGTPTSEPEIQVRTGTTPLCGQARGSLASHNGKSR